jgi:hypothetical protein
VFAVIDTTCSTSHGIIIRVLFVCYGKRRRLSEWDMIPITLDDTTFTFISSRYDCLGKRVWIETFNVLNVFNYTDKTQ